MGILFHAIFIIVPVLAFTIIIFTIVMMFSPKLRGKMMSNQVKATKYMLDESKEDLTKMGTTVGNVAIQTEQNILNQNEEVLQDLNTKKANIKKEAVRITTEAIKDGFTRNMMYCKYCGKSIDEDSTFCKHCGKQL